MVAFDGGTGQGSAIAPRHDAHAPATNSTDSATGCDFTFDGGTGSGSAVSYITPGGAPGSPGGPVQLLAATTNTSTPVPPGTEVASGQAAYVTTGNSTLALALTPAGRSLLGQVKAADAAYWAANPQGQSPPYAQLTLTLGFTPDASASPAAGFPVVVPLAVIAVVAGVVVAALLMVRQSRRVGTATP